MKGTARFGMWALVLAIGLFAGIPSHADLRKGNGEVGFDLGFTDFDSELTGSSQGGLRFDVRAGYVFSDLFELEGLGTTAGSACAWNSARWCWTCSMRRRPR
jgi:hypothetical protein